MATSYPSSTKGKRKDFLNWSRREPKDAAKKAWEMAQTFERHLGWRHIMSMRGALAYTGAGLGNLFENLNFDAPLTDKGRGNRRGTKHSGWANRSQEQHAKAMIKTITEKLLGMDEPKCQLVATDADYEVRRQGVWADRFVDGTYHLTQGSYQDFWDLARQAALVAFCSTGTTAIRTEPDYVAKRVRSRLRSTLNTFIDPADLGADRPLSYFDVTWESPEYLCEDERWKGKADAIWASAAVPRHMAAGGYSSATFGTPMVKVLTAWRMPFGSFKGRHAVFIGGNGESAHDEPLYWEDWEAPEPPLAFFRCDRNIGDDFWSENLIEISLDPLRDAEDIDEKAKLTMRRTSQTYLHLDGTSTAPDAVMNAKDVNVTRYSSALGEKPVQVDKPGILHADYFNWRKDKIQTAHELLGLSMMHQAGEVQGSSGQRSGRSIRLEAGLLPERYARILRGWRNLVAVDCAKNHIRAAKQIGKVDPDWQVTWPGADFDAKVSVKVLDIDLEAYTIQAYAVSEQKNTPAERADAAQEMFDRGEISAQQLDVILEGLYDTKRETKASVAERAYVSKVADEMLHGDPDLVGDEAMYMATEYIPPMPWMDPDAMLAQAAPIFTQALIDKVPQNRRSLLRRLMEDIWALRQQQQREVAMANASVNVATTAPEAFPMGQGLPPLPGPGGPGLGQPALPPPGTPGLGGPSPASVLGAPAAPPVGAPALNAPGAPGMV